MNHFQVDNILDTFSVICDTREHITPKAAERYKTFGVPYDKATLKYGDYCGQIMLPGNKMLYDISKPITAKCVIERKMSLDELAACFTRDRERFKREFERAKEAGAKVFLLVENASWEALYSHRYRSKLQPNAFIASITAWTVRYNITPVFCKASISGKVIKEFLYRDIKERLEKGEYG